MIQDHDSGDEHVQQQWRVTLGDTWVRYHPSVLGCEWRFLIESSADGDPGDASGHWTLVVSETSEPAGEQARRMVRGFWHPRTTGS